VNLVVNARDAMPEGGTLTIETANVDLDESYASTHPDSKPGPYVMLAITDTGSGMPPETQARVFEPFFTTKEKGKGTGLGLATVFGVVRQSGGTIWLYSELGHGTTFKIYLPRTEERDVQRARSSPPGALNGHETILVVENDPKVRQVVVGILRRFGYHVLAAESPQHAVDICMTPEAIHLVISDVMMPGTSGPDVVAQLVSLRSSLKTLFISGYTDNSVVAHGVEAGARFLQKPITPDALGRKVREILDG